MKKRVFQVKVQKGPRRTRISFMGRSPRGTPFLIRHVDLEGAEVAKAEVKEAIEAGLTDQKKTSVTI